MSIGTGTHMPPTQVPGAEARTIPSQRITIRAAKDDPGTFEGLACPWDTEDSYGTRFAPECFSRGGLDEDLYAYLWMHSPWDPIGTFNADERSDGLWIKGQWDTGQRGGDARAQAVSGSAPELSVGFVVLTVDPDDTDRFTQVRLMEVSQVTRRYGAVPGAGLREARSKLPREGDRAGEARQRLRAADAAAMRLALAAL